MPIQYTFCFICREYCIKNISSPPNFVLISSVLDKIIPDATTPTFQEMCGLLNPHFLLKVYDFLMVSP